MTRNMWGRLLGTFGLVLGIGLLGSSASNAADEIPKAVKDGIMKIAGALEAGKKDEAKKDAEALAKKEGFDGGKPGSCESLMHAFAPRKKGGFGFGDKAGKGAQDGIELKVQALGSKKPMTKKQMDAEKADIQKMAYVTLAVADVTLAAAPRKDNGKQKAKDWIKWTQEMREASAQLAAAAGKGDAKGVQSSSKALDGSCTSCHEVFRK